MNRVWGLLDNNRIFMRNLEPHLAVEGQKDIRVPLIQLDLDNNSVREDQWSIGQGKGTDWGEYDHLEGGMDDRPTG